MKYLLRYIVPMIFISLFIVSCEEDKDEPDIPIETTERTVIIYMSAENDLSSQWGNDYEEIVKGAKILKDGQNLLIYVDCESKSQKPFIAKITSAGAKTVRTYEKDDYSCNPEVMKDAVQWIVSHYPAKSYGLVMWGHSDGTGWFIQSKDNSFAKHNFITDRQYSQNNNDSVSPLTRAFMYDDGKDNNKGPKWMNIPTFAKVLNSLPHFDYVFFDVCSMVTAEVVYEIRDNCDYVIGSPAEVPVFGAPYEHIVTDLFLPTEGFGKKIVDDYISYNDFPHGYDGVPLSVIKTSNIEALAHATMDALPKLKSDFTYPINPPVKNCIYYYRGLYSVSTPMMHDIRDFMFRNLSVEDFNAWDKIYHETVIYTIHPPKEWLTVYDIDFDSFTLTDDNYGGLSMFIPHKDYSKNTVMESANVLIREMQWSNIVDWTKWGWKE